LNALDSEEAIILLPPDESNELGPTPGLGGDTLADSVVILLTLTVVQRLVGFCRAVLFCRWLPPEELGQWDMAFSFLMLAAPLSMLALPSCFGRYLEHYRQQGHLRTLIGRTAVTVLGLTTIACGVLYLGRAWFSQLIFGSADQTHLVALMAGTLWIVVSTHYFLELLTALRNVRFLAMVQFANSLAFAVLGALLLFGWARDAGSVVLAYGGACLLSSAWVLWRLWPTWRGLPAMSTPLPQRDFWAKIFPYVGWVSLTSLMANLFEIVDRYMIVHYSTSSPGEALALVGQYHSSRVVPLLMISVALMLGTMITPHLSHDWEQGLHDRVKTRLNLFLKLLAFALCGGSAMVLLAAPILFDWALAGKFQGGREILPHTLTYCIWFGMTLVSQNYLLCAEKARLGSLALVVGLGVNIILNVVLLPRYGLVGAVWATMVANVVALVLMSTFNRLLGFRLHRATVLVLAMPALLCIGPWTVLMAMLALGVLAILTDWILDPAEKEQIGEAWSRYAARFQSLRLPFRGSAPRS
jgi:polysaccharide transporter, PST family